MNNKPIAYLMSFLIFVACALYIYGIYVACRESLLSRNSINEYLSSAITGIIAVLSTNLGAVLGITVTQTNSSFNKTKNWNPLTFFTAPSVTTIQIIACYVYILSLVVVTIVWIKLKFEIDTVVPIIPQMSKSLLGVVVGALAVALNTKNQQS